MEKLQLQIKRWLLFFMIALFLSGVTAIPLEPQLAFATKMTEDIPVVNEWLEYLHDGVLAMQRDYPFLAYGYDWLAFAHFVLAILFIGPYKDPVRNKWVIDFGLIACLLILPFAFIAGHYRGMPVWWRLIDCSFGLIGAIPLLICRHLTEKLEAIQHKNNQYESYA